MSQAKRILKEIAITQEYKALVNAIEKGDYDAILSSYQQISKLIERKEKEVKSKMEKLIRKNKREEYQRFRSALARHAITVLPQWYWLSSELEKQNIMEGEVVAFGSEGDPLVETAKGKVVIIRGATLTEGERVWFKVTGQGKKIDFGKVLELTPSLLYSILIKDTQEKIRNSLALIRESINKYLEEQKSPTELSGLLRQLEGVKDLVFKSKLQEEDKRRFITSILEYRKGLLKAVVPRLAFQFVSQCEEKILSMFCSDKRQQVTKTLSPLGLFCYEAHESIKAELLPNGWFKGYQETIEKLEKNLNSMATVMKLLEFKAEIKELYPLAKEYLQRMDRFFQRLFERATAAAIALTEDKVCEIEDIYSAIKKAFSIEQVCLELQKVFYSLEEFFTLREAFLKLRMRLKET